MSDCRFGVSPVNYPDPDPDPGYDVRLVMQYNDADRFLHDTAHIQQHLMI